MATLLLRISAPMQSWGTQSHFSHRDTGREPSKSGVVGLLCAALGRPRTAPINDLVNLRMGVRVEQEGMIRKDYHTAGKGGYYKVVGKVETKTLITSTRYYLADARFLVGLEGDATLLETLQTALQNPAWFLFFGRKAFVPTERVWLHDGLQEADLLSVLETYPWLGRRHTWIGQDAPPEKLRVVVDDPQGTIVRNDHPISFAPRRFLPRSVTQHFVEFPGEHEEMV